MPASEADYQNTNRNIYISEILVLNKTHSEKFNYMLKLVTFVYTLDCNISWIYKHKDKH